MTCMHDKISGVKPTGAQGIGQGLLKLNKIS